MKKYCFVIVFVCLALGQLQAQSQIPNTPAGKILQKWLVAHNTANHAYLQNFVKAYHPQAKIHSAKYVKAHTDFYLEATKMFGKLETTPYKIVKSQAHHLEVQFLKSSIQNRWKKTSAEHIVMVKVDINPKKPQQLARGLGMGALICYQKKKKQ